LVWVDNKPVTLLYGALPQWRPLKTGMDDGPDVKQLEEALVDLGYAKGLGLTVDNTFTSVTETAVKRMQKALSLDQDGVVDPGEIVFLSGPSRITSITADVGEQVGQSVVQVSSTKRAVELSLDASDRSAITSGQKVSVELPDGKTFDGTVRSVATTVTVDKSSQDSKETVAVVIDLPEGTDIAFDQSPVSVSATTELAKDVLTAPVTALLAVTGGGYAVERVNATSTEMVPVEVGVFGDGYVEIKGNVNKGDKVAVAS
jgi:peptidoglycan hydrolase-like protein with peptidoglycan-binding domain